MNLIQLEKKRQDIGQLAKSVCPKNVVVKSKRIKIYADITVSALQNTTKCWMTSTMDARFVVKTNNRMAEI